jgi:HAD superfamily hydrolase (TIGR01509 family)
MMFEAVIFDWDGTLADTRQVIVVSFQKALSEVNCIVSDEYIERRIGIGAADTFYDILQSANIRVDQKMIEHLVDRKSQLEIELTSQVELFPGAKELLETLHGKVKMGLASMNNRSVIIHMVNANGLNQFFQAFLTAESISHSKPHPEIFIKTVSELKTNPEKCVVIEDSIFGVKAAKSANMGCVAVTTGVYSKEELKEAKPDLIVKTLCDNQIVPFILN